MIGKYAHSRMRASRILCLAALILFLIFLTGCSQRELCYDHSHLTTVSIEFDWSDMPDANPNTMVVYFFPTDNSQYMRYELTGDGTETRAGFNATVKVPAGTYHVVCHNGETENNEEQGEIFYDFNITTYDTELLASLGRTNNAPRPDDTDDQPIRQQASRLYSYTLPETVILEPNENRTIVMKPHRSSIVINVTIENVKNMKPSMEFCGIISGLAESHYPSTDKPGGRDVIVPLVLAPDGNSCLRGSMEVFGCKAPHDIRHKFRLYTSQKYYYDFDVTNQIHSATGDVNIVLSDVTLPDNSNGMGISVGDWEDAEDIEITM